MSRTRRMNAVDIERILERYGFEVADASEIQKRLHTEVFVIQLEVAIG